MSNNTKYKALAKNTILFAISSMGSKILVFLLVPLYTSVLSTGDYGVADIITTTSNLLIFVFTINIADAVLRFSLDNIETGKGCLSYGLKVIFYGSGLFLLGCCVFMSLHLVEWENYCYAFLFLFFLCQALYQVFSNFLRAADKIKEVAIAGVISTLVMIILNLILLLLLRIGLVGYLISLVGGQFAGVIYCVIEVYKIDRGFLNNQCPDALKKEMRRYSIPLIFNGIAWWMNSSIDKYFVTGMISAAANGIYAVSYKIPTILTVFQTIFSQAWNLSAIKEYDKNDEDGFFGKTYSIYNALLVIACSGLIILNVPLARLLYANEFFVAWKYSSVLLISIVFSALGGFVGSVFSAVKNSRIYAVSTVVSATINIILNAILIPSNGILGAAIATDISFFMIWFIRVICARKYIRWRINWLKDGLAYILLVIQVICGEFENHAYLIQLCISFLILIMYRHFFAEALSALLNKIKGRQ